MKLKKEPTLSDSFCDLRTRKIKTTFFTQMNKLLDCGKISLIIDTHYQFLEAKAKCIKVHSFNYNL